MLIPSQKTQVTNEASSLSRRVNANSQLAPIIDGVMPKLIKKGEC